MAPFDAHIIFSTRVPRAWCQLADTGIALLALTGKGRTAFGEPSTPRLLLSINHLPRHHRAHVMWHASCSLETDDPPAIA